MTRPEVSERSARSKLRRRLALSGALAALAGLAAAVYAITAGADGPPIAGGPIPPAAAAACAGPVTAVELDQGPQQHPAPRSRTLDLRGLRPRLSDEDHHPAKLAQPARPRRPPRLALLRRASAALLVSRKRRDTLHARRTRSQRPARLHRQQAPANTAPTPAPTTLLHVGLHHVQLARQVDHRGTSGRPHRRHGRLRLPALALPPARSGDIPEHWPSPASARHPSIIRAQCGSYSGFGGTMLALARSGAHT